MEHPTARSSQFSDSEVPTCKLPDAEAILNPNYCAIVCLCLRVTGGRKIASPTKLKFLNTDNVLEKISVNSAVCAAKK